MQARSAEHSDCMAQEKAEAERRHRAGETETHRLASSLKETADRQTDGMRTQEERVGTLIRVSPHCMSNSDVSTEDR